MLNLLSSSVTPFGRATFPAGEGKLEVCDSFLTPEKHTDTKKFFD